MPDPSGVFRRYYLYQATNVAGFIWPVFTLFLLARGLTFTQIAVLSSISSVVLLVGEVPTGVVGDRVGRRNSLVASKLLMAASLFGFVFVESFLGFVAVYVPWAVGRAFASGSEEAWLYATLERELDAGAFSRVHGRGTAIGQWSMAATMVAGSLLYALERAYPFVAAGALGLVGVGVLLTLPKNPAYAGATGTPDRDRTAREVLVVARDALLAPPLRRFVGYVALFFAVTSAADTYIQPIAIDVFEGTLPMLRVAGAVVPEEAALGVLYAGFTAVAAVASYHAATLEGWLGRTRATLVVPLATAVTLAVPLAVAPLAVPAFFVMKAARSSVTPLVAARLTDHVPDAGRATVLSAASMAYTAVGVPLALAAGAVADATSALAAVAALGGAFLLGAAALAAAGHPTATPRPSAEAD